MLCVFRFATLVRCSHSLVLSLYPLTVCDFPPLPLPLLYFYLHCATRRCLAAQSTSLLTFCYFITRFRVFCFARDLTLLYFTFTLRYVTYSFRYVTLLLVKRFLSFFIVILVFCFCALLLISVFILIPPRAFIALGRSFIFARILSPISLSFAFVFIFLCLLIGARAAGCVQLNSILI